MKVKRTIIFLSSLLVLAACSKNEPPVPDIQESDVTAGLFLSWQDNPAVPVTGAAMDGATTLDLVVKVNASCHVKEITVETGDADNGVFLNGSDRSATHTTIDPQGVQNENQELCYIYKYKVPSCLPAGMSQSAYNIDLKLSVTDENGVTVVQNIPLSLIRTPVLFVHGLASAASTFDPMLSEMSRSGHYPGCALYALDYSGTALSAYSVNESVVSDNIDLLKQKCLDAGYAVGKVDVVGHSMGGILTRLYLQSTGYRDDIRAFIGIDVPHSGSQLADLGIDFANRYPLSIFGLLSQFGAINDLRVASEATASLNGESLNLHTVPSHSICATLATGDFVPSLVEQKQYLLAVLVFLFDDITDKLYGEPNDVVVPLSSQQGGKSAEHCSLFGNEWHCSVHTVEPTADRVMELLDGDVAAGTAFSGGFNPPKLGYIPGSILGITVLPAGEAVEIGKGGTRTVEIPGFSQMESSLAVLWNPVDNSFEDVYLKVVSPDTFRITVPEDAPDQLVLHAAAKDAGGNIHVTTIIIETVVSTSAQSSI